MGSTTSVSADYVFTATRHDLYSQNINVSYNPATGVNYPFSKISTRPYPDWGLVEMWFSNGRSNYHGLQTALQKRFTRRWQASGTYTLSTLRDGTPQPVDDVKGCQYPTTPATGGGFVCNVPMTVAPDLGGQYTLSVGDQRHRATINGIVDLGYGFQVSGLYFYGSGQRFVTTYGGNLRDDGGGGRCAGCSARLRPDGTIVPRNNFVGHPIHRVDLRLQRQFRLGRRAKMDGLVEVFNLFNHANYGSYVTAESAKNYGVPSAVQNVAYYPRMLQLGFHLAF
jgi:hypothetical protein